MAPSISAPRIVNIGNAKSVQVSVTADAGLSVNSTDYSISANNMVTFQINSTKVLRTSVSAGVLRCKFVMSIWAAYTASGVNLAFGGPGANASTVTWNASAKTVTLTLGEIASGTQASTTATAGSPTAGPPVGVTDTSGNQAVGVTPDATSKF